MNKPERQPDSCESPLDDLVDHLVGPSLSSAQFPGYEVLGELGAGGMGQVWRARDAGLGRVVAIKSIKQELTAVPLMKERFLREARALAKVHSDHVVAVHQVGESRGAPFVVMELLKGESLHARIARTGPLSIDEVFAVGIQACRGLDAIHRAGLVHRDIKPSNLWLEARHEQDAPFRVKVLDFGLVRHTDGEDHTLTLSGAFLGTPAYMSPEQAAGLPVEPASDLFSLGAVLYYALTGRRPFGASMPGEDISLGSWQFMPIEKLRPDAPSELNRIIAQLLGRDPLRRPKTAKEAADALERARPSATDRPSTRNSSRWWIPGAAAAAILISAGAYFFRNRQPANNIPDNNRPPNLADAAQQSTTSSALPSWYSSRKTLRVSTKGDADFKTVQDALDAVESGQAIEIVGPGPYRELLENTRHAKNIGIFARTGAIVEIPAWKKCDADRTYDGAFLEVDDGLRLFGLEFRLPPTPADGADVLQGLNIAATGDLIVERCVIWQPSESQPAKSTSPFFMGLVAHSLRKDPLVVRIADNFIRGGVAVMDWQHQKKPVSFRCVIERNLILGGKDALWLPLTHGEYTVRFNILSAFENGVGLSEKDESGANFSLDFQNNTVIANHFMFLGEDRFTAVGKANIVNNLVANRNEMGISGDAEALALVEKAWTRSHNIYAQRPGDDSLPLQPTELVESDPLESTDFKHPAFARPRPSASTAGKGGDLPKYAGVRAPNGDADYWITRWQLHPAAQR